MATNHYKTKQAPARGFLFYQINRLRRYFFTPLKLDKKQKGEAKTAPKHNRQKTTYSPQKTAVFAHFPHSKQKFTPLKKRYKAQFSLFFTPFTLFTQ